MTWWNPTTWGDESGSTVKQRKDLNRQGSIAGDFANFGQAGYENMSNEANAARQNLADQASGKVSLSAEQLRQGLQQNQAAQQSMAASASPQNAAMAARTAAMQSGRLGYGLAGQQATAGLAERMAAAKALQDAILQQRQQDAMVGLQSRGNAINAYGGIKPEGSTLDKWGKPLGEGMAAFSDQRLKTDITDGDARAKATLAGLKSYSYRYKDAAHGKGDQFGTMAQEMERAGLGHAVIDTPSGKVVHGAKAALSGLALTAALARRVSKLEGGK